ncbi:MAG: lactate dehydrogenase [Elusimicrobia bacterium GWA2_56_46]|nr:MAG: lactate dehydrogenase [Elusimicrobia bacterium GWA2_56_46]OGR55291.1 MAG: lactate dehydrogenase [Elusimicrobia bacterium GWC2_56_31]HBB66181.1 lactate dehydrogenase [Elusimicrobiota bacterium]HBW23494.1 lactate dehydrogenase [Elusimicrobiota bacterium]
MEIEKGSVWIKFAAMEKFMRDVFIGLGVPKKEAAVSAEVLITADKLGFDSHGISRLKPIYYDRIKQGIQLPTTAFKVVKEAPASAVIDGGNGMGHVVARRAMELAIRKARKYGIGMTAVRNSTHYGIAGYYPLMAVKAGMIGITGTNARPSLAPTFGIENMLGTNPLTFGMPTDEKFPFLLDCATSITQRGKIEVYAKLGKKMPAGWVIDRDGRSKTDSRKVLVDLTQGTAALVPLGGIGEELGGYKGYGYATAIEILCAALQRGAYMKMLTGVKDGKKVPYPLGHFFIAINISAFTELKSFKRIAGSILRELRASKKMPGARRIFTAGEKEHLTWLARKDKGVPVNKETQREIILMRDELGLKQYKFPF